MIHDGQFELEGEEKSNNHTAFRTKETGEMQGVASPEFLGKLTQAF